MSILPCALKIILINLWKWRKEDSKLWRKEILVATEVLVKKPLDPEWKDKLATCLKQIGIMDSPFSQITINVADSRIREVTKQIRYK